MKSSREDAKIFNIDGQDVQDVQDRFTAEGAEVREGFMETAVLRRFIVDEPSRLIRGAWMASLPASRWNHR